MWENKVTETVRGLEDLREEKLQLEIYACICIYIYLFMNVDEINT